jgi:hypothetical protein
LEIYLFLGENDDHQFVGRSDFSYIFTDEFDKVPYNLRFFTGGDQTFVVLIIKVFHQKIMDIKLVDKL